MKTPVQQPLDPFQKAEIRRGLEILQDEVARCEQDHGWLNDPITGEPITRNDGEAIALMHSELSEALEAIRNSEPALWYEHSFGGGVGSEEDHPQAFNSHDRHGVPGKPQGAASELADTIIRILAYAEHKKIPVIEALIDKHNYNITRPYRHGGKTA